MDTNIFDFLKLQKALYKSRWLQQAVYGNASAAACVSVMHYVLGNLFSAENVYMLFFFFCFGRQHAYSIPSSVCERPQGINLKMKINLEVYGYHPVVREAASDNTKPISY